MKKNLYFILFVLNTTVFAQKTEILLANPSLEGDTMKSQLPPKWNSCGALNTSPPDTQPGSFGVTLLPKQGRSYLGMVVRDNGTYESIYQKLSKPLQKDSIYQLKVSLAHSEQYNSFSSMNNVPANFNQPCILMIWAGSSPCDRAELLVKSEAVTNTDWKNFAFIFKPSKRRKYIIFDAFFAPDSQPLFYNGNLLIDAFSSIQQM
jgi:hypothetical protein